ncbi:MAG: DUF362 domain-containing protein [Desulfobacter sp.]
MKHVSFDRCDEYKIEKLISSIKTVLNDIGGVDKTLGKKGGRVLIKPNMMAGLPPEENVTTHPEVIRALIRIVKETGRTALVGDSPAGFFDEWNIERVWEKTGINTVVNEEGAEKVVFEAGRIQKVETPYLPEIENHYITSYVYDCDAVINVPKFKTHTYMVLSGAVKNLFGFVPGKIKGDLHCKAPKPEHFSKIIACLSHIITPCTSIMDAVYGLEGDGPGTAGQSRCFGWIAATDDPVSLDIVLSRLMGISYEEIPILKSAAENNWGEIDMDKINLKGISLTEDRFKDFLFPKKVKIRNTERFTRMIYAPTKVYPKIEPENCTQCLSCIKSCPVQAISMTEEKKMIIDYKTCIECCCCHEVCTSKAIDLYGGKSNAVSCH